MLTNDTLAPREAAYIATNAYFTLKDWINYSDGKAGFPKRNPVAGAESMDNLKDRVLGTGTSGTFRPDINTSLKNTPLANSDLKSIHTAKTGLMTGSGFGYTLTFNDSGRKHVVIAVRGTRPELKGLPLLGPDLLTDAHGSIAMLGGVGHVHAGFKRTYESMLPSLDKDGEIASAHMIHCVGHSLGGAVATLVAARCASAGKPVKLYTFGSPRVGANPTHQLLENVIGPENIFRVAHNLDPISLVGPYPYLHVNGTPGGPGFMTLPSPFNLGMKNHDMMEYIKSVGTREWGQLESLSSKVNHDDAILAQVLLHGEGNKSWLRVRCAKALTTLFRLFSHELRKISTSLITAATAIDLLAELVFKGTHRLVQLGSKILGLMSAAAEWAGIQVPPGAASFTATIIKVILDRMLETLKPMIVTAVTRGPIGLTPLRLHVPGIVSAWAL